MLPRIVVEAPVACAKHAGRVAALLDRHGDRADEHRRRNEHAHHALPPAVLARHMGMATETRHRRFRTLARADTRRCRGSQLLQDLTLGRVHFLFDWFLVLVPCVACQRPARPWRDAMPGFPAQDRAQIAGHMPGVTAYC
ncbi:hypothetical protein [Burkholderia ubonensis]|uniref:hypothetical protein n=1 Tax=Burkholderia ubonensis TaxID=101571 RepID=UPI0039F4A6B3